MATVVNRTTKEIRFSVHTPDFLVAEWIINPDLSSLAGVPNKYWNINGDLVTEMNPAEKAVVDQAEIDANVASERTADKVEVDDRRLIKAVLFVTLREVNILRGQHSLADRTESQMQTAVKDEIDIL